MARPATLPIWATAPADPLDVVIPALGKQALGWSKVAGVPEKPPYEWFNWYQNLSYQWAAYWADLTDVEFTQLKNIDAATMTAAAWLQIARLGAFAVGDAGKAVMLDGSGLVVASDTFTTAKTFQLGLAVTGGVVGTGVIAYTSSALDFNNGVFRVGATVVDVSSSAVLKLAETTAGSAGAGSFQTLGGIYAAKAIYCATTGTFATSVATPIVASGSSLVFKVSTTTTAATFDASGFLSCPATAGNHTFGTAGTSALSTGLIVQAGDTGVAALYLYAGTLNFVFRCEGAGGFGGALSIDNGNALFNMAKCTQTGVWTFPSAGRHTFGASGTDTGLEVFTGTSNLGIRINANAAPTLSFYTSNTDDVQIRNFGIVNNYNTNGALDFMVSDVRGGVTYGTGSTVIARAQMTTGVVAWGFGISAQAGAHLFHGYLSANAGGTSGTATTQHPYLACKTIKGTLDANGDLDVAHSITAGGSTAKERIAYIVCKFVSGSNWSSFSDSVPYSITWDDTNILFRSTLTAVAIEFFVYYEAA